MRHSNNLQNRARRPVSLILAPLVLVGAAILGPGPAAFTATNSVPLWTAPINLGPGINSTSSDQGPALSPDGLSLYFTSNRTGGLGGFDMYVSQRASLNSPWSSPLNLGSALNTTSDEGNPAFSRYGNFLFFQSKRPGGLGGIDIWVAQRSNPHDDFSWQAPVNLGPGVNSGDDDNAPTYFEDDARGTRQLYFGSTRPGLGGADIYVSNQMPDRSFGPATLITELSSSANENRPSIRRDGLEIFFQSNRTGSNGTATDLWVATRASALAAWSAPVNLGDTTNTASIEQNAYLSSDALTLFFASDRSGGSGGLDLYMSTRTSVPAPSWTLTGNLNTGRQFHTATLLPNGKVLVAGGNDSNRTFKSAELYDPATAVWTRTADLNTDRDGHTATLLQSGKVLVAGGFSCGPPPQSCFALNSAELYDPASGTWTSTGNLVAAHDGQTATLLPNGKVLIVGGDANGNSAELYDPLTGTWSPTGSLNLSRYSFTATLLPNGKVLVAGGADNSQNNVFNSAELYDPAAETWSSTGSLVTARSEHTATLLPNGKVLVAGGFVDFGLGSVTDGAELYDPATGTWSSTGKLNQRRAFHTATMLGGGKVLIAAGFFIDGLPNITNGAELYDPDTGTWSYTANLNAGRRFHTATLLLNGKVLAAGGTFGLNTAELYDPGSNQIDDAQLFVRQHYLDFLNREPDAGGLAFWANEITSCGADSGCIEVKRINVSAAFFLSIEFQETGYLVYRIYKSSYGNLAGAPVPVRLNEFLPDTQQIGQGIVVGAGNWQTQLEANKQTFVANFVSRARFSTNYPFSMTPAEFVDTMLSNAGVSPPMSERASIINEFGSAATSEDSAARARVLRRVAENSTLKQQEFNRAFVLMQYFGYLRRNPNDPPELTLDFQGYNFWLNKLNQFNGNFVQAEMVKAFLVSTEYRQRFGQP